MELKGLLNCMQDPDTGPCPKPYKSNPRPRFVFEIHFKMDLKYKGRM
jgi:hypothetical protein